ncbi:putative MFS family arabinose efflux permease [Kribbella orskensis]|uniref:MFS family arabinose efflux permease n=1 Tax=Kribbella orskensis TaxID=2512216 RepID=A0ABY2BHG4_9ACTN|nr:MULTISPECIES: MFS transporter [Kribbella]TCN38275.1 putative MFS family arabinose efflux permease [Kribbella sp. VKM Ac-2500]TCO20195.1 putative MFS family arabinose efflux permease [Kribbella orskensis]
MVRKDRDFRRFWTGHTISAVGTQVTAVALPLTAALTLDAGAAGVSAIATATYLPSAALPLLAGHWLERRRKRGVMVAADVLRAAAVAVVPIAWALDSLSLPLLVIVGFVVGAASVVFDIASFAYLPDFVAEQDLPAANRALQGSTTASQVGGPGISGLLVQLLGPALALLVDSVSYLASALGVAGARRPEVRPAAAEQKASLWEGVRQLRVSPFLRSLTVHAAVYNASAQILVVNLVILAVKDRGLSAGGYGLALSAGGAGAFVGAMLGLRLAGRLGYGRAFGASLVLSTGLPLLLALLPGRGVLFGVLLGAVQFGAGIGLGSANVLSVTIRQLLIPRSTLARSNGAYRTFTFGVLPIGAALGGVLGANFGTTAAVAIGSVGIALSALPMFAKEIRRLQTPVATAA